MKKITLLLLCLMFVVSVAGCTNSEKDTTASVLQFVIDEDAGSEGVILYAVMKNGDKSEEKKKEPPYVLYFDGGDVHQAFDKFFDSEKNVYTGTVKEYAINESADSALLDELKLYITNSPKLPAKRKTVTVKDVNTYINEKLAENTD